MMGEEANKGMRTVHRARSEVYREERRGQTDEALEDSTAGLLDELKCQEMLIMIKRTMR